jgi:hypothetical protein
MPMMGVPMALAQDQSSQIPTLPAALYPRGFGRFVDGLFMSCWLVIWVGGELAVVSLLGTTIVSLIAAILPLPLPESFPLVSHLGAAAGFLLFSALFLTMWSVGGVAVCKHLFRNVAGEDRVWLTSEFLVVHRRAGLFRSTTRVPRHDIRRISMTDRERELAVYSSRGMQTITTLGTPAERRDLRITLMRQLELPDAAAVRELEQQTVPPQWETRRADLGYVLYRPTARVRRQQVRTAWFVTGLVALGSLASVTRTVVNGAPLQLLPSLVTTLCATVAMVLMWGRQEWVVGTGRLALRRRFRHWISETDFEDGVLELSSTADSDGDVRYDLYISTPYGDRKKIASAVDEPCELYWLAKWLAAHTRFYLDTGSGAPRVNG